MYHIPHDNPIVDRIRVVAAIFGSWFGFACEVVTASIGVVKCGWKLCEWVFVGQMPSSSLQEDILYLFIIFSVLMLVSRWLCYRKYGHIHMYLVLFDFTSRTFFNRT